MDVATDQPQRKLQVNEDFSVNDRAGKKIRLGRLPRKSSRRQLNFADFVKYLKLPTSQTYWKSKPPLPLRSFGNRTYGDCTRAKQAVASMRMERLEGRGKQIDITDAEVIRVYFAMTQELYGGGDTGAYEEDALACWRNPDKTFKDTEGHPHTIDAFMSINPANQDEVKLGLALAGPKGIAICLNLPEAFSSIDPPTPWDVPEGQPLTSEWMPGSWGGHSLWVNGFTKEGLILDHTWEIPNQTLTWNAVAAYMDEAHVVIDSVDSWRHKTSSAGKLKLNDLVDAVNAVSSIRIAA